MVQNGPKSLYSVHLLKESTQYQPIDTVEIRQLLLLATLGLKWWIPTVAVGWIWWTHTVVVSLNCVFGSYLVRFGPFDFISNQLWDLHFETCGSSFGLTDFKICARPSF